MPRPYSMIAGNIPADTEVGPPRADRNVCPTTCYLGEGTAPGGSPPWRAGPPRQEHAPALGGQGWDLPLRRV